MEFCPECGSQLIPTSDYKLCPYCGYSTCCCTNCNGEKLAEDYIMKPSDKELSPTKTLK